MTPGCMPRWPTSIVLDSGLVDDSAVLQTAEIKHAHTTVLAAADKYIDTVGAESHIVDLLVVSNELGLCCQRRDVPNGASGIDARGDDETRGDGVPVQGR